MVAPVPAQIPKLRPRLPAPRRWPLRCSLPTTHYALPPMRPLFTLSFEGCSGLSDFCVALFPVFERSTPLLPIISLQPQQFHAITHSFAQRRRAIPPIFNGFRTLSIATGVYPSSFPTFRRLDLQTCQLFYFQTLAASLLSLARSRRLFSIAWSLFSKNTRVGGGFLFLNLESCSPLTTFRYLFTQPLACWTRVQGYHCESPCPAPCGSRFPGGNRRRTARAAARAHCSIRCLRHTRAASSLRKFPRRCLQSRCATARRDWTCATGSGRHRFSAPVRASSNSPRWAATTCSARTPPAPRHRHASRFPNYR